MPMIPAVFAAVFTVEEVRTKKSHIHILESETLGRESRVTETAQEIVGSIPYNCEWYSYINNCQHL